MPQRLTEKGRKKLSNDEVIEYARKIVDYFVANWKRFAYLDNPNCAELRLYKFDGVVDVLRLSPLYRHELIRAIIRELSKKNLKVVEKLRRTCKVGRARMFETTVLVVCFE